MREQFINSDNKKTKLKNFFTSPSSSRTSRNTPWAAGCCGPKLTVMFVTSFSWIGTKAKRCVYNIIRNLYQPVRKCIIELIKMKFLVCNSFNIHRNLRQNQNKTLTLFLKLRTSSVSTRLNCITLRETISGANSIKL